MKQTTACQSLQPGMVPDPVEITAAGALTREAALAMALAKARQIHPEVMLLAWYERTTGEHSPKVTC